MPLVAQVNGIRVEAPDLSDTDWSALRDRSQKAGGAGLVMSCCGQRAVPRTSKAGLRHFAHYARGECTSEPESLAHLTAKATAAQRLRELGWTAEVEHRADDSTYVADVHATRGRAAIAVEVQLSRIPQKEAITRMERQVENGLMSIWIVNEKSWPGADVPGAIVFPVEFTHHSSYDIIENAAQSVVEKFTRWVENSVRIMSGVLRALRNHRSSHGYAVSSYGGIPYRVDSAIGDDGATEQTFVLFDLAASLTGYAGAASVSQQGRVPPGREAFYRSEDIQEPGHPDARENRQHAGHAVEFIHRDTAMAHHPAIRKQALIYGSECPDELERWASARTIRGLNRPAQQRLTYFKRER